MSRLILKIAAVALAAIALGLDSASAYTVNSKPTVSIVNPTSGQHLTSPTINIFGKASYTKQLAGVYYNLNGGGWTLAVPTSGLSWSTWWAPVTLTPGTNTLKAYAIGTNGVSSSIVGIKFYYDTAPKSLSKSTITADNGTTTFTVTFGATTFSMSDTNDASHNGVGSYTNSRINGTTSKVKLIFTAPPTMTNKPVWILHFDTNSSGYFYDADNNLNSFTLDSAASNAPSTAAGKWTLENDDGTTDFLDIPVSPMIAGYGNLVNPLTIWIDEAYPGNLFDQVTVKFNHWVVNYGQLIVSGRPTFSGIVTQFGSTTGGTNTVTVYFPQLPQSLVGSTEYVAPIAGLPLNILSYSYTNTDGVNTTTGAGTFTYRSYGLVGGLLSLNTTNGTDYDILNFDSTTSGTYMRESRDFSNLYSTNFGTFSFTASVPVHTGGTNVAPADVIGRTLTLTNSSDYFEQIGFTNATFTETNSIDGTNSAGTYAYNRSASRLASATLTFTDGPNVGFTNQIFMTFVITNTGTFVETNYDDLGNFVTNYSGSFQLQ